MRFISWAWDRRRVGTDPRLVSKSATTAGPGQFPYTIGFGSLLRTLMKPPPGHVEKTNSLTPRCFYLQDSVVQSIFIEHLCGMPRSQQWPRQEEVLDFGELAALQGRGITPFYGGGS